MCPCDIYTCYALFEVITCFKNNTFDEKGLHVGLTVQKSRTVIVHVHIYYCLTGYAFNSAYL